MVDPYAFDNAVAMLALAPDGSLYRLNDNGWEPFVLGATIAGRDPTTGGAVILTIVAGEAQMEPLPDAP